MKSRETSDSKKSETIMSDVKDLKRKRCAESENGKDEKKELKDTKQSTETNPPEPKRRRLVKLASKDPSGKSSLEVRAERKKEEILGYRTSNEVIFIDSVGEIKKLKTAILVNGDKLPIRPLNSHELKIKIPSHRDIEAISEFSEELSPIAVKTPTHHTTLPRVASFGSFSLFSNGPKLEQVKKISPILTMASETDFFNSPQYEHIKEIHKKFKFKKLDITYKELEKRRAEDEAKKYRRDISQNRVMGVSEKKGSATNYAQATELFAEIKHIRFEWLHLVGHFILGAISQARDNLVGGTSFANTDMMFGEKQISEFSRLYPQGITLTVRAQLIPDTHLATTIEYVIKTPDFEFPLIFNAQTVNKPHIDYQKYFDFVAQEMVKACQKKTQQSASNGESSHSDSESKSLLFYTKKEIKDKTLTTDAKSNDLLSISGDKRVSLKRKIVIDTETTGLNKTTLGEGHRVVEIGCVELIDDKPTGKTFRKIIDPERPIPKLLKEQGIHNITDEVVKGKPKFKEIADEFLKFIEDAELIGHNLPFDLTMLENELRIANRTETFVGRFGIDTLEEARKLLKVEKKRRKKKDNEKEEKEEVLGLQSYKLGDLCKFYEIDTTERKTGHGALIDAELAAKLYMCLEKEKLKLLQDTRKSEFILEKDSKQETPAETAAPALSSRSLRPRI